MSTGLIEYIKVVACVLGYGVGASIVIALGFDWANSTRNDYNCTNFGGLIIAAALWPLTLFPAIALAFVSRRRAAKLLRAVADYDRGLL